MAAEPSVDAANRKAGLLEPVLEQLAQAALVVDHQNARPVAAKPILRLTPGFRTHAFVTIGPAMTLSDRPFARLFCVIFAILAASGCARPSAAARPPRRTSRRPSRAIGSIQPARHLAGVVAPYQNVAIQSTLAEPADTVNVREGDDGARRAAARPARYVRSPGAARVGSRDRKQQSRQYRPHRVIRAR